jgi:hypothetical protein
MTQSRSDHMLAFVTPPPRRTLAHAAWVFETQGAEARLASDIKVVIAGVDVVERIADLEARLAVLEARSRG